MKPPELLPPNDPTTRVRKRQCAACPWRKDVVPSRDIPNGYCSTKHRDLKSTIASPGAGPNFAVRGLRVMACHESPKGREQMCSGWTENQLGVGNNIALRMLALTERDIFKGLTTIGEQHRTLAETLGEDDEEIEGWE